jgi:hypothetical protein
MMKISYQKLYDVCCDLAAQMDTAMPMSIPSSPDVETEKSAQADITRLRNMFCYLVSELAEVEGEMTFASARKVYQDLVVERMAQATFLEDGR